MFNNVTALPRGTIQSKNVEFDNMIKFPPLNGNKMNWSR